MQKYSKVLSYYQKDLPANHSSLATSYNSISVVYDNMSRGQGGKGETPVLRSTGGVQAEYVKYGGVLESCLFPLGRGLQGKLLAPCRVPNIDEYSKALTY
jgi:hypothetical protein